jgi:hypothetical protein
VTEDRSGLHQRDPAAVPTRPPQVSYVLRCEQSKEADDRHSTNPSAVASPLLKGWQTVIHARELVYYHRYALDTP